MGFSLYKLVAADLPFIAGKFWQIQFSKDLEKESLANGIVN